MSGDGFVGIVTQEQQDTFNDEGCMTFSFIQGFVSASVLRLPHGTKLYTKPHNRHSGMVSITVDCAKFLHYALCYTTEEMWDAAVIERLYELNDAIKAAQEQQHE
jgi:hypothetical protein